MADATQQNAPLTVGQELALAEAIGGLRPWPTVVEEHTYTERIVLGDLPPAGPVPEEPTVPEPTEWHVERLAQPIVERTERLAWPWEFPGA